MFKKHPQTKSAPSRPVFGSSRLGADAYLEQYHIVEFFWEAIASIAQDCPLNPYPTLVEHFQQHEIQQSLNLHLPDSDILGKLTIPIIKVSEKGRHLYHASKTTQYWALSGALLPHIELNDLQQLHGELDSIIVAHQTDDHDLHLISIPSVATRSVFSRLLVADPGLIEITRDVFITSGRFETGLTSFTKYVLQDVINLEKLETFQFQAIAVESSNWDLPQIYANRNAFFKDLKRGTVANSPIVASCVLGRTHLRLGRIRYVCHFRTSSSAPLQSFDTIKARSVHLGVFVNRTHAEQYFDLAFPFDRVRIRQQYLDELRPSLEHGIASGRYYAVLATAVMMTLSSGTPNLQLIAMFSRMNQSLPGSLQKALASIWPCLAVIGSGNATRHPNDQYARAGQDLEQLVQIPLNSELVVLAPIIRALVRRSPPTRTLCTVLNAIQDTITARVLALNLDLSGAVQALSRPDEKALKSAQACLQMEEFGKRPDQLVVDLGAINPNRVSALLEYLVDMDLDRAYRDAILALTGDARTRYPYAKLAVLFAHEAMRLEMSVMTLDDPTPRSSPLTFLPQTDLAGIFSQSDLENDGVVFGSKPALSWCRQLSVAQLLNVLAQTGVIPPQCTIALHGPACLLGTLLSHVHEIHFHLMFELIAERFEAAVIDFCAVLIEVFEQCHRRLPAVAGVHIGAQYWTMAQWQQGPEVFRASINAALSAREPIVLDAFLCGEQVFAARLQFTMLYVNRLSGRCAVSSQLPSRTICETITLDADSARSFFRMQPIRTDLARSEASATLRERSSSNQMVAALAMIAVIDADNELADQIRSYQGTLPERFQSCWLEFDVLRAGLKIASIRQICSQQLRSWQDRVRGMVTNPSFVLSLSIRKRLLTSLDDVSTPGGIVDGVAEQIRNDLQLLESIAMELYISNCPKIRSFLEAP